MLKRRDPGALTLQALIFALVLLGFCPYLLYRSKVSFPIRYEAAISYPICYEKTSERSGLGVTPYYNTTELTWPNVTASRLKTQVARSFRTVDTCIFAKTSTTERYSFERRLTDPVILATEVVLNPPDCRTAKYSFALPHNAGLGSILHVVGNQLRISVLLGRVFVIANEVEKYFSEVFTYDESFCVEAGVHGFSCFFEPLSNCTNYALANRASLSEGKFQVFDAKQKHIPAGEFFSIAEQTIDSLPSLESISDRASIPLQRTYATELLLRPNARFVRQLKHMYAQILPSGRVPDKMISVCIRWGDKWKESLLLPMEKYVDTVTNIVKTFFGAEDEVVVFLQTGEADAHQYFLELADPLWNIKSFDYDRTGGLDQHELLSPMDKSKSTRNMTTVSLASAFLAADALYHVGTSSSNWDRVINELRHTRGHSRKHNYFVDLQFGDW